MIQLCKINLKVKVLFIEPQRNLVTSHSHQFIALFKPFLLQWNVAALLSTGFTDG